jgi:hypothetical protein
MSNTELLIKEIETLPADYTARILDFIEFLKNTAPRRYAPEPFPSIEELKAEID